MPNLSPYKIAAQIALGAIALAALVALVMSWSSRGQRIEALEDWQVSVVQATTVATVQPDSKGQRKLLLPNQVPAAIAALNRTADSCLAASAERDRIVRESKARADAADLALANVQAIMQGEFSSAEKRIKALEAVKAQPTPELQCQQIGVDSKAAWEGWK